MEIYKKQYSVEKVRGKGYVRYDMFYISFKPDFIQNFMNYILILYT